MTTPPRLFTVLAAFALLFPLQADAQGGFGINTGLGKKQPVTATLLSEQTSVVPGSVFRVAVKLDHAEGYHTYGKTVSEDVGGGLPTTLTWKLPPTWKAEELPWPETHATPSTGGKTVQGYAGVVYLPATIQVPADARPGDSIAFAVTMDGAACNPKECRMISLPASLSVTVAATAVPDAANADIFAKLPSASATYPPAGTSGSNNKGGASSSAPSAAASSSDSQPTKSSTGFLTQLLFAFLGGLILNIMPCVFPVLGIKVTSVVKQSGESSGRVLAHGLAYTLGILVSFWVLVAILQSFRAAGQDLSWGFQLQNPWFTFTIVLIIFIFGLNMAGVFEIGTSATGVGMDLTGRTGLQGSFFTGLFATLVATPCSAPFLASALTFAINLSLWPSLAMFTVIGLGLASPFLVLACFPRLLKLLPRPGPWMESFKQAMAFLMLAAAAYFAWALLGQISDSSQRDFLIGIVFIAAACWIYGRWFLPSKPAATRVRAVIFAVLVFAFGYWMAYPRPKDGNWKEWSPELVAELREKNIPVFIDYTARWCSTCQANKWVYRDSSLQAEIKKHNIVLLRADYTNPDARIKDALAQLDKEAVPVNVLYVPGRKDPIVIDPDRFYSPGLLKEAIAEIDKAKAQTVANKGS